jgi:hypothetical protein
VEDDHVDRPGVEVQQCMKLTGTNSSIGLIVLIDQSSSNQNQNVTRISCLKKRASKPPASRFSCASLTWWSWRGGCTRSHSEHGRETPLRQWYFVSRRGRVGRCQVCKTHVEIFSLRMPRRNGGEGRLCGLSCWQNLNFVGQRLRGKLTRGGAAR